MTKKITKNFVLLALLACLIVGGVIVTNSVANAYAEEFIDTRLLMIVANESELDSFSDALPENTELITVDNFSHSSNKHIAYAVSQEMAENPDIQAVLQEMYLSSKARIYIYGDITIKHFNDILGISEYSVSIPMYDGDKQLDKKGTLYFGDEQVNNKLMQIICLSKNDKYQSLTVTGEKMNIKEMQDFIINHYNETFVNPYLRASIVKSNYAHKVLALGSNVYLNVDYILYKDNEESDSQYDYFALRTNVTAVNNQNVTAADCDLIEVKHQLQYSSDHVTDYAPRDVSRATSVSVGLSYGPSLSANIGISFGVGGGPTIDSTYNTAQSLTTWKVKRYWFFGGTFSNEMVSFGTSWASTGRLAAINVSTYARFIGYKINHIANWDTQQVRYSY